MKYWFSYLTVTIVLVIVCHAKVHAIISDLRFERISTEQGLPNSILFDISQDKKGFMWFGTSGGFSRYDGLDFKNYLENIKLLYVDRDDCIWTADAIGSVKYLDPKDDTFFQIKDFDYEIVSILQSSKGLVYLLSSCGKIFSFNKTTKQCKLVLSVSQRIYRSSKTIIEDREGKLWFGLGNYGFLMYNPSNNLTKRFLLPLKSTSKVRCSVDELFLLNDSTLLVGGESIWRFHLRTQKLTEDFNLSNKILEGNSIHAIVKDKTGNLWFSSATNLYKYNFSDQSTEIIKQDKDQKYCLRFGDITRIYVDKTNNLWVGTIKDGLYRLDLNAKKFHSLIRIKDEKNSLSDNLVSGVYVDKEDKVWMYPKDKILNVWDRKTNKMTFYPSSTNEGSKLKFNSRYGFITGDDKGAIWVAPWLWTLHKLTFEKGQLHSKQYQSNDIVTNKTPAGWSYRYVLPVKNGGVYIAYSDGGIDYLDSNTDTFVHHKAALQQKNSILKTYYWTLLEDHSNKIWAGHSQKGFDVYFPKKNKHQNFVFPIAKNVEAYTMLETTDRQVFIGTSNGIFVYDAESIKFQYALDLKDGLPHKNIRSILEDSHKNLWIGTDKGLVKYSLKDKKIMVYSQNDGLTGDEFSVNAASKNSKGEMFFGCENGLLYFHPDSIKENTTPSEVVLTEFKIMQHTVNAGDTVNGRIILNKDISFTNEIELNKSDKEFTIGFTAIHFSNPERNSFVYKLEGWDRDWIFADAKHRFVTYANLPEGTYYFKVKASNRDNIWNESPAQLTIIIRPHFWETWWFKLACILLIACGAYLYYQYRIYILKNQKEILKDQVESQTESLNVANRELQQQKEEIETQNKNINILAEIGQKITSSIKATEIVSRVYESVNQLMDAEDFSIGIVDNMTNELNFHSKINKDAPVKVEQLSLDGEDRLSVWCVKNSSSVFMADVEAEIGNYLGKKIDLYINEQSPKSLIYMPLVNINKHVIGILIVKSFQKGSYTQFHFSILQSLASYISIALDNANAYQEIELQTKKLRVADEMKSRFLTNISHEFKTPLTLILGPLENLKNRETEQEKISMYELMERNAHRLQRLIHQLLDLSKLEEGVMMVNKDEVNMGKSLYDITSSFRYLAKQKNIHFEVNVPSEDTMCVTDLEKVEEVLYNLLSNAFKYTIVKLEKDNLFQARISCSLSIFEEENVPMFKIELIDNGIGISETQLPMIFDRFFRADKNKEYQTEGVGIGLSLTKRLIELLEGTVTVSSIESLGTSFVVKLPFTKSTAENTGLNLIASTSLPHLVPTYVYPKEIQPKVNEAGIKKILIVEDNSDIRLLLYSFLSERYQLIEASNGKEGLQYATEQMPDLIISDIMMPVMDGLEFCKFIKADWTVNHIPIILLTARSTNEARIEGFDTGADEYLTKPFDRLVLLSRVQNLIDSRTKLLDKFSKSIGKNTKEEVLSITSDKFLQQVIEIIELNISNSEFSIDKLVHEIGMSRTQFFRKFGAVTGSQPNDFIRQYRMRRATTLLDTGAYDITQVAYEVGFEYANYFARCFKEEFGISPSDYLRSHLKN